MTKDFHTSCWFFFDSNITLIAIHKHFTLNSNCKCYLFVQIPSNSQKLNIFQRGIKTFVIELKYNSPTVSPITEFVNLLSLGKSSDCSSFEINIPYMIYAIARV